MYRSSDDKIWGGVCAGLAHKFGFNKVGLRIVAIICVVVALPITAVAYGALWLILSERPTLKIKKK